MTDFSDLALDEIVSHLRHERSRNLLVDASLVCVGKSYSLTPDDLARPDLIAAAQTFAILAVARRDVRPAGRLRVRPREDRPVRWLVLIAPLDETDPVERVEFTDDEAYLYAGEAGVLIQTGPDRLGGYANERVVPWRRVLEYQKIGDEGTVTR